MWFDTLGGNSLSDKAFWKLRKAMNLSEFA